VVRRILSKEKIMKLYYSPGACSLSPHIVFCELGLAPTLVKVSTKTHQTEDGADFYGINPKGYVPVLELDNGQRLTEGPVIVQYLADLAPEKKLVPANGTFERYRLQEWLGYINSEVHKLFGPLFDPTISVEQKAATQKRIGARLDWIAPQLADKYFLLGEQFTVADAYLFTILNWTGFVGMDLGKWPTLANYVGRIAARPAVQAALKAEGLLG
jgi:glutathione S-transferase